MQKAASNQQTEYKNWFYIVSLTRSWFEPRCVMELLQCWGWLGHHPQFRSHFSLAMCHMCSCIGDCSGVIPLASSYLSVAILHMPSCISSCFCVCVSFPEGLKLTLSCCIPSWHSGCSHDLFYGCSFFNVFYISNHINIVVSYLDWNRHEKNLFFRIDVLLGMGHSAPSFTLTCSYARF